MIKKLTVYNCACRRDSLSYNILCSAGVRAGIFRIGVHDIQRHEAKAICLDESGAGLDRFIVVEPFDFHRCVGNRNQPALEMRPLPFLDLDVVQRSGEDRGLGGRLFNVLSSLISGSVLKIMNLLEANLVFRIG